MKWPAYPKYKDSGIEWLGQVPEHWATTKAGYYLSIINGFAFPSAGFTQDECDVRLLRGINVGVSEIRWHDTVYWTRSEGDGLNTYELTVGTMVLGMDRPWISEGVRVAILSEQDVPCLLLQRVVAIHPSQLLCRDYLYRILSSPIFVDYFTPDTTGVSVPHISPGQIRSLPIPLPPLPEQHAIAAFLDRETGRIDLLVSKKRTLIERLKEKRTALISRTVTRGLPPAAARAAGLPENPTLKPSGNEWLGEVPEGWDLAELRRFSTFITSGSRGWAEHYADDGSIFIRIGNLTRHSVDLDLSDVQHVNPPPGAEGERTRIRNLDLLFSITAYLGSVAVASSDVVGAYINQHIALVRANTSKLWPRYAAYWALGDVGQLQLSGLSYGGTKLQLSLDDVLSLWVCVPPLPEQQAIAAFLDAETAKLDALVAKVDAAIERLLEYRTALITAAVTGKIDVRGSVA